MSKYRHRAATRSASAGDVLLAVDKSKEDHEELKAYEAYLEELRRQARKKKRGGLFGSILGAIGGFLIGGPAGMMAGYTAGKNVGVLGTSWDDYKDNKRELNKHIWKGGKFDHQLMQKQRDDLKQQAKDVKDADLLNAGIDALMAGISIKGSGGFLKGADKAAWKSMSFGERIGTAINKDKLIQDKLQRNYDKALTGKGNVLDLVQKRNKLLDPKNIFGGSFTPFQDIGATMPFRTGIELGSQYLGGRGAAGQLAALIQSTEAVKRGQPMKAAPILQQWLNPDGTFNKNR